MKDIIVYTRVPEILNDSLEKLQDKLTYGGKRFTKSDLIREAILNFIEKHKDLLDK
jgi:hypothetical protein